MKLFSAAYRSPSNTPNSDFDMFAVALADLDVAGLELLAARGRKRRCGCRASATRGFRTATATLLRRQDQPAVTNRPGRSRRSAFGTTSLGPARSGCRCCRPATYRRSWPRSRPAIGGVDQDLVADFDARQVAPVDGEIDPDCRKISDDERRLLLRGVFAERNLAVDDRSRDGRPHFVRRQALIAFDVASDSPFSTWSPMRFRTSRTTPGKRGVT